jgi:glyoxylase-like metal-dependent hydrolase (beta-lactamase superfamily II)
VGVDGQRLNVSSVSVEHGALPGFVEPLGHGIFCLDTGFHRPRFDAAYLVVDGGRAAFIDTGTNFAVPRLLAALEALGLARDAVDWVIPTHVHLDHAGGAGLLMRELPHARMWIHPRGQRHMVDPAALYQGALAVYGEAAMARTYGELVPVDAARVSVTHDGMSLQVGSRRLQFADTPGHALHHHCIWDEATAGWFTGDTFGLSYREFDSDRGPWILATSTPVQFDPPVLAASVARLLEREPRCMYLTHFGRVGDVARLGAQLVRMIERMVVIGRGAIDAPQRHQRLREALFAMYLEGSRAHGCTLGEAEIAELLEMDVELNAQGLAVWLDRKPKG